jgi:hypothetical protein
MLSFIRSRPVFAKTLLFLLLALQAAGVIVRLRASVPSARPTQSPAPAAPRGPAADTTRALDRFLDHHPLLEDKLRVSPQLVSDAGFLAQNPDLRDFMRSNPVAVRLSADPRHLLYRALLRQASAPLPIRELEVFDELLDHEPALERALNENPESIRESRFLKRHPALHEFLLQRPRLAAVFLAAPLTEKHN